MFQKMKLATKMAILIGSLLTGILGILIVVTILMSSSAITAAVAGELNTISKSNSQQIQQMFSVAEGTASDISSYLERELFTETIRPEQLQVPRRMRRRHFASVESIPTRY